MTGNHYLRSAMMPLDPEQVFFLIQAGWPADGVLFSGVALLIMLFSLGDSGQREPLPLITIPAQ